MTTKEESTYPIDLKPWSAKTFSKQAHAAAGNKHTWVVDAPRSPGIWYAALLNNLACKSDGPFSADGTIQTVQTALSHGLSRAAFDRFRLVADLSSDQLSRIIGVPQRTLSRRIRFRPDESERLLRVASAFQRALGVLGSVDAARRWFVTPKRALGDKTPLAFCDTQPGAEEVEHLLGRIEQGVFS